MPRTHRSPRLATLAVAALLGCSGLSGSEPQAPGSHASTEQVQTARSSQGIVVAGHPEAAELGVEILAAGGSAMDAAVAVSLALGVAEPYGSGLGGKMMMLYREASSGEIRVIDAMDEASASLNVERFTALGSDRRTVGWGAVAIPGLLAGLERGHELWGRLPWRETVLPAAELARAGSLVLPGNRTLFERRIDRLRASPETSSIYLPGDQLPAAGSRLTNPDLATTLERIAEEGSAGFYRGSVAEAIASASAAGDGSLTLHDLARYEARVVEPLIVEFKGHTVVSSPPPSSGGATVLAALARLDGVEFSAERYLTSDTLDTVGAALERLYPEIQARIADVPEARRGFEELVSESAHSASARSEGSRIRPGAGGPDRPHSPDSSTTHFVVLDAEGNLASVTQSLSHHFGSGMVAPGTGVLLNNTMKNFSLSAPGSPNAPRPGKRPRSTIAPTLVLRDGNPVLALGLPGGQRIPTATLQVLLDFVLFGSDLETAVARPRAHLRRPLQEGAPTDVFELERADEALSRALGASGWSTEVNEDRETFGGFCAIEIEPDGSAIGVADLRRTNAARSVPGTVRSVPGR